MSLVIFFGFALMIFLGGMTVISVTLYHWYKEYRERKQQVAQNKTQVSPTN
jgi:hypothetical protein